MKAWGAREELSEFWARGEKDKALCGVTGKKNLAVRYNELGDRHTYALNKYHFGTLFVRQ